LLDQSYDQALSAEERDKRKQAAADKLKEINNSKVAIEQFDRQAQSQVADSRQRINSNLLTDIQQAVADRAKAGGYTIVVNSAATDTIVYASTDNDLTDDVLKQLNAGAPIDVTPAAPPAPPILMSTNSMP
jgi:Skp family chaperone for outer membrane proteins